MQFHGINVLPDRQPATVRAVFDAGLSNRAVTHACNENQRWCQATVSDQNRRNGFLTPPSRPAHRNRSAGWSCLQGADLRHSLDYYFCLEASSTLKSNVRVRYVLQSLHCSSPRQKFPTVLPPITSSPSNGGRHSTCVYGVISVRRKPPVAW